MKRDAGTRDGLPELGSRRTNEWSLGRNDATKPCTCRGCRTFGFDFAVPEVRRATETFAEGQRLLMGRLEMPRWGGKCMKHAGRCYFGTQMEGCKKGPSRIRLFALKTAVGCRRVSLEVLHLFSDLEAVCVVARFLSTRQGGP